MAQIILDLSPNKVRLRVRAKITSQNWRSDLVQIWLIRESKTTEIASSFEANFIRSGASEVSAKDGLKMRCKNVKLFLREPLVSCVHHS
jgi:hypothetical protein